MPSRPIYRSKLPSLSVADYKIATFHFNDEQRICDWLVVASTGLNNVSDFMAEIEIADSADGTMYAVRLVDCDDYAELKRFAISASKHPAIVLGIVVDALSGEIDKKIGIPGPIDAPTANTRMTAYIVETTEKLPL